MAKIQLYREFPLKSSIVSIIWHHISTDEGLSQWLADDVKEQGQHMQFLWGDVWRNHEIRTATIKKRVRNSHLRLKWDDETDPKAYLEMRIEKSELTGDYVLQVTDFAEKEDIDSLNDLWEENMDRLHRNTGI